ncbi:MAG: hypothetical protein KIG14_02170 [Candidatus Sacchiramonaceae bacterium]|nr:hypothetical protein [Candidatus Saccharimonadaceae bacterium]
MNYKIANNNGFEKSTVINDIPIPKNSADESQIQNVFNTAYLWAGIIAIVVIIASGAYYVASAGSPERVKTAKNILTYAIVGLVIVALAFTITSFVLGAL